MNENTSKKILVISPTPSHPQNAGNRVRIYQLLVNLQEMNHEVHFLYINVESSDEEVMKNCWSDKFYLAAYKQPSRTLLRKIIRKLKSLFTSESKHIYAIDDLYDNTLNEFIVKLSLEHNFDTVIVEYVFFSKALECFDENVLKIIDTHDSFTNRHKIYLQNNQQPRWYSTTAKEEKKGLNRANIVIAIQPKEKDLFSSLTDKKVITVSHLVPLHKPVKKLLRVDSTKAILFLGSANPINVHGISFFMKDVFPRIKLNFSNVQFLLAGEVCDVIEDFDLCTKLGKVDSVEYAYSLADLVVNPVLFGTGLNIKSIEALGYSKPLVTTTIGSKGLEDGRNTAFLVADSPENFSLSIINILSNTELADKLSKNAYKYAKRLNEESLRELASVLV